jgi:hypothetical protein
MASMSVRLVPAVLVLALVAGCGGDAPARELRLLAPVGIAKNIEAFEQETGCRVDLRVYDEGENVAAIARRRDADAIAGPTQGGRVPDVVDELAQVTLKGGVVVTIPRRLASAFDWIDIRPAGRRQLSWTIREEGDNEDCARRWIAYATSQ